MTLEQKGSRENTEGRLFQEVATASVGPSTWEQAVMLMEQQRDQEGHSDSGERGRGEVTQGGRAQSGAQGIPRLMQSCCNVSARRNDCWLQCEENRDKTLSGRRDTS